MKKKNIRFDKTERGVTIWIDGCWVLDASCFKEDMTVRISTNNMKKVKSKYKHHLHFKYGTFHKTKCFLNNLLNRFRKSEKQ